MSSSLSMLTNLVTLKQNIRVCTAMSATRPKRQRKAIPKDPLEDDELPTAHTMANAPSSSAWSIRESPKAEAHVAPLISLCIQVFATNMRKLATRPSLWESNKEILKVMPEAIIPRLRAALRNSCPTFLSHEFISTVSSSSPRKILTHGSASTCCAAQLWSSAMTCLGLGKPRSWL